MAGGDFLCHGCEGGGIFGGLLGTLEASGFGCSVGGGAFSRGGGLGAYLYVAPPGFRGGDGGSCDPPLGGCLGSSVGECWRAPVAGCQGFGAVGLSSVRAGGAAVELDAWLLGAEGFLGAIGLSVVRSGGAAVEPPAWLLGPVHDCVCHGFGVSGLASVGFDFVTSFKIFEAVFNHDGEGLLVPSDWAGSLVLVLGNCGLPEDASDWAGLFVVAIGNAGLPEPLSECAGLPVVAGAVGNFGLPKSPACEGLLVVALLGNTGLPESVDCAGLLLVVLGNSGLPEDPMD